MDLIDIARGKGTLENTILIIALDSSNPETFIFKITIKYSTIYISFCFNRNLKIYDILQCQLCYDAENQQVMQEDKTMNYEVEEVIDKPEGWPANAIECQLENIQMQLDEFMKNPSYKNREVLVSLVSDYDLNQRSMLGLFRTTDYEVSCINNLFMWAYLINFNTLKTYLYELIGHKTRMQKIASWFPVILQIK